jgi:hypothetical protein
MPTAHVVAVDDDRFRRNAMPTLVRVAVLMFVGVPESAYVAL